MADVSRRDALRKIAVGGAAAATVPLWIQTLLSAAEQHAAHFQASAAQAAAWAPKALTSEQNETVITLAELIIPQTETAGATKANVNRFIDAVLADASPADRQKFVDGLAWLDTQSQRDAGVRLRKRAGHQTALLTAMSTNKAPSSAEQLAWTSSRPSSRLTITGYYTSEVGMREEMGDERQHVLHGKKGCTHAEHKA